MIKFGRKIDSRRFSSLTINRGIKGKCTSVVLRLSKNNFVQKPKEMKANIKSRKNQLQPNIVLQQMDTTLMHIGFNN